MKNITTEFKNNGVFRYFIKTLGFSLRTTFAIDGSMYFVDKKGNQIALNFYPVKNIVLLDNRGYTHYKEETITSEVIKKFINRRDEQVFKSHYDFNRIISHNSVFTSIFNKQK